MKLKIFDKKSKVPEVYLRLIEETEGRISVVACDEKGNIVKGGYLISFIDDGTIVKHRYININLGFKLDCDGRIEEGDY